MAESDLPQPRTWKKFAGLRQRHDGTHEYADFVNNARLVAMSGYPEAHPVTLVEDPGGDLRGYIDLDETGQPQIHPHTGIVEVHLVQHHRLFAMQFTYGLDAELERGRGQVVHLRAEPGHAPVGPAAPTNPRGATR